MKYDKKYKESAIKLAYEIGAANAIRELGLPKSTLYAWLSYAKTAGDYAAGAEQSESVSPENNYTDEISSLLQNQNVQELTTNEKGAVIAFSSQGFTFFAKMTK